MGDTKQQYVTIKLTSQQAYTVLNIVEESYEDDVNKHRISTQAAAYGERLVNKIRKNIAEQLIEIAND